MAVRLLQDNETDDPILSVVNLIDIFLVIIAALLITVARHPVLSATLAQRDVTVITNAGRPDMEMVVKQGEKIDRYQASGRIGQGDGDKAGVAYRLKDGSLVYVPEPAASGPRP